MTRRKVSEYKKIDVLALEDSTRDFELIREQLLEAGYDLTMERVETRDSFSASLQNKVWDIILADFKLPGLDGFDALAIRNSICPDTPFICVSGAIGEETAIELLKLGCEDYVLKDRPDRLPFAVGRALDAAEEKITLERQDEQLKASFIELQKSQEKLQGVLDSVIQVVAQIVEARDPYTAGHEHRVAMLAAAIAEEMAFPPHFVRGMRMAGEIHDLGKISIPAEILSKPRQLNKLEYDLVKNHSRTGYEILSGIEFPWPIADIVYQHHERIDGSGYPRGLKGEEMLIEARILAVADVIEAMASHRPYRPGMGQDIALSEIESQRGVLYDPDVVDACLKLFREKAYSWENQ